MERRLILSIAATAILTSVISVSLSRLIASSATDAQAAGNPSASAAAFPTPRPTPIPRRPCTPRLQCQVNDIWNAVIKRGLLHVQVVTGPGYGANSGSLTSVANCPTGTHELSGGFLFNGAATLVTSAPVPGILGRPDSWEVVGNLSGYGGVEAAAVCIGS